MVNFWIFREYSFGSPFRNVNSGRNTEGDDENNRRLQIATERYLEEFKSINYQCLTLEQHGVEEYSWATQNGIWAYPAIIAPLTYSLMRLYTRPNSNYIRKVGVAVTSLAAY